jgi:hypothetical protein
MWRCVIDVIEIGFPPPGDRLAQQSMFINVAASMTGEITGVLLVMFLFRF